VALEAAPLTAEVAFVVVLRALELAVPLTVAPSWPVTFEAVPPTPEATFSVVPLAVAVIFEAVVSAVEVTLDVVLVTVEATLWVVLVTVEATVCVVDLMVPAVVEPTAGSALWTVCLTFLIVSETGPFFGSTLVRPEVAVPVNDLTVPVTDEVPRGVAPGPWGLTAAGPEPPAP
jgi:hypothetical protein